MLEISKSSCPICNYQSEVFSLEIQSHEIDLSINEINKREKDLLDRLEKLLKGGFLTQKESETERKSIFIETKDESKPLIKERDKILDSIKTERDRITEEKRVNKILSGDIEPIKTTFNLKVGEKLYYSVQAERMATFTEVTERTESNTDNSDALGRGCGCGCLFGWLGALLGALSANSKTTTKIIKESQDVIRVVDKGLVMMTNKRIVFYGENLVSVDYDDILLIDFEKGKEVHLIMKYANMLNKEFFNLYGEGSTDCDYYYKGIINKLSNKVIKDMSDGKN